MSDRSSTPLDVRVVRPRRGALWQKLLLATGAVVIELLAAEGICRFENLFPPEPRAEVGEFENRERSIFVADPDLGWRMRPGASFNWKTEGKDFAFLAGAEGFRIDGRPDAAPPHPDAPVFSFVGDSFTFGSGVECVDTFAARTAAALGATAQNRGQPGFGVDQMWSTVDKVVFAEGPPARLPDLVVVTLILDDLERSMHAFRLPEGFNKPLFKLVDGRLVRRTAADNAGPLTRLLERHSQLWTAAKGFERRLGQVKGVGAWWRLNAACLAAIVESAHARSVPVVVVHIATPRAWKSFPALADLLRARDVPLLDLGTVWPAPPDGAYYLRDGHLTPEGHRLVAKELAQLIKGRWPTLDHSRH